MKELRNEHLELSLSEVGAELFPYAVQKVVTNTFGKETPLTGTAVHQPFFHWSAAYGEEHIF